MQARDKQARLERESKCKSEEIESDKVHRCVPISCLDPLESKIGFSHMSIFSQSAERSRERRPMASGKSNVSPCVSLLEQHRFFMRSFSWVSEGPISSLLETTNCQTIFLLTINFGVTARRP